MSYEATLFPTLPPGDTLQGRDHVSSRGKVGAQRVVEGQSRRGRRVQP